MWEYAGTALILAIFGTLVTIITFINGRSTKKFLAKLIDEGNRRTQEMIAKMDERFNELGERFNELGERFNVLIQQHNEILKTIASK